QLPGVGDGVRLEVVAEREVAQHLEERVVPPGEADVVQIVVFAPGADAFLGAGGTRVVALLPAGKNVLELDHPGVGEKQRRVVQRDERRGPNPAVASLLEESKEGFSDLVGARGHGHELVYQGKAGKSVEGPSPQLRKRPVICPRRSAPTG